MLASLAAAAIACATPFGATVPGEPTPVEFVIKDTRVLTEDDAYYRAPAWSPDGGQIAAVRSQKALQPAGAPSTEGDVVILDLISGDRLVIEAPPTVLPQRASAPVLWRPSADEIAFYYFDLLGGQSAPYLARYKLGTAEVTANELCLCRPIAFGRDATELLVAASPENAFELRWISLATGETRNELSLARGNPREHMYFYMSLSPDSRILLLDDLDGNIFSYEMGSGEAPELLLSSATSPAWSPDGSMIAYASFDPASGSRYEGQLMIANSDGSSPRALFKETYPVGMLSPAWSPDGTQIAFLYGTRHSNALLIAEVPEELLP